MLSKVDVEDEKYLLEQLLAKCAFGWDALRRGSRLFCGFVTLGWDILVFFSIIPLLVVHPPSHVLLDFFHIYPIISVEFQRFMLDCDETPRIPLKALQCYPLIYSMNTEHSRFLYKLTRNTMFIDLFSDIKSYPSFSWSFVNDFSLLMIISSRVDRAPRWLHGLLRNRHITSISTIIPTLLISFIFKLCARTCTYCSNGGALSNYVAYEYFMHFHHLSADYFKQASGPSNFCLMKPLHTCMRDYFFS